ncbi:MAG TPA: hypothetical protein VMU95_04175 [Trebonia sp.]|nr:hypothetical protein [Trebonia sp.]
MPGLPRRPHLDQLRRQARELLRAAVAGEPAAITRIQLVSPQLTLSAAQLALAREHGFRSWPALRAEAEARRLTAISLAGGPELGPPPAFADWWSFGGAGAIETLTGLLHVEGLVAGPDGATGRDSARPTLFARLVPSASALEAARRGHPAADTDDGHIASERQALQMLRRIGDIAVVDDRGARYALESGAIQVPPGIPWIDFEFPVDPIPGPDTRWLDLSGQGELATRLLPSARVTARAGEATPVTGNPVERDLARRAQLITWIWLGASAGSRDSYARETCPSLLALTEQAQQAGTLEPASQLPDQLTRLCAALTGQAPADRLPAPWASILTAADQLDGSRHYLDIGLTVPPVDGMTIRLDALTCTPYSWRLHMRFADRWPAEVRGDGHRNLHQRWRSMQISADDDRGNSYIGDFGPFTSGDDTIAQSTAESRTRLDPLARRLRLTFTGSSEQVTIDLELGAIQGGPPQS